MENNAKNHLALETSLYLQQHVHNPVDWYPWSDEALNKAKKEDKPILLSIGYSACHWCHVMAHESFEHTETASLMNKLFINIKVDREERPDLDKIYQMTHALLTQRGGGWPLTVFLTPDDLVPFFSGTYFPLEPQHQLPAFRYVLRTIHALYQNNRHEIIAQNKELYKVLNENYAPKNIATLNTRPIELAQHILEKSFDQHNGGFGAAPKFPQSEVLLFLLDTQPTLTNIILSTLNHMARGGIYDQLGGGFFRYATDAKWLIPHFEKMLYDNAQLILTYTEAYKKFAHPLFATIAKKTAEWALDTMQSPSGGFYATIDADSEGHEGSYYLWDKDIIKTLLTPEEYQIIDLYFGLNKPANFAKKWHLAVDILEENIAIQLKISLTKVISLIQSAKNKLFTARQMRIFPQQDKKILTAWNGLMINALLEISDVLDEPSFATSAHHALLFIQQNLIVNKRLHASFQGNRPRFAGFLDDYAFLLKAVMTSLRYQKSDQDLEFARFLADILLDEFFDEKNGGFFFTSKNHEKLIQRPKSMVDEATPSGNGIAVDALIILGNLVNEPRYIHAAEKTLSFVWEVMTKYPVQHASLLVALARFLKNN